MNRALTTTCDVLKLRLTPSRCREVCALTTTCDVLKYLSSVCARVSYLSLTTTCDVLKSENLRESFV